MSSDFIKKRYFLCFLYVFILSFIIFGIANAICPEVIDYGQYCKYCPDGSNSICFNQYNHKACNVGPSVIPVYTEVSPCQWCANGEQVCLTYCSVYQVDGYAGCSSGYNYCSVSQTYLGTCPSGGGCKNIGESCPVGTSCCPGADCVSGTCVCSTVCPDPATYCPGQTAQDGCGNNCSAPGTKICDPGAPTNLNHSANTINTITWVWTQPLNGTVTKYQLFDSLGNLIADNIQTTSFQETNLSTNTSYARYAKACNQTVCSNPSNTASAYTSIQPVDTTQCTSITPTSIQIIAYSTGGSGFSNITYGSSGIRFQRIGFDAGYQQSNTYIFANLSPSATYTFTAGPSKNGDSESTAGTANVTCTTAETLSAPANLHHTANTYNTIDWAWNAVSGTTYYNIYSKYFSNGNPYWRLKTNTTDITYHQTDYYAGTSYGWWALTENTMYGFGVSACNVNGCSGLSMADAATSILPPSDIDCQNITQTSIRDFAVGSLANLTLGSSGIVFREAGGATQDSQSRYWNLSGLIPETTYSFYAKARNQDGELTTEFGPKTCSTLSPTIIPYSLRIYGPSSSILKLALISVEDALLLNRGTIKTRMPWGDNYAAYLVATSSPNASPVRVMTPTGIKAWRLAP